MPQLDYYHHCCSGPWTLKKGFPNSQNRIVFYEASVSEPSLCSKRHGWMDILVRTDGASCWTNHFLEFFCQMARVSLNTHSLPTPVVFKTSKILQKRIPNANWESPHHFVSYNYCSSSPTKEMRYMHACVLSVREKTSSSGTSDEKEKVLLAQRK